MKTAKKSFVFCIIFFLGIFFRFFETKNTSRTQQLDFVLLMRYVIWNNWGFFWLANWGNWINGWLTFQERKWNGSNDSESSQISLIYYWNIHKTEKFFVSLVRIKSKNSMQTKDVMLEELRDFAELSEC